MKIKCFTKNKTIEKVYDPQDIHVINMQEQYYLKF